MMTNSEFTYSYVSNVLRTLQTRVSCECTVCFFTKSSALLIVTLWQGVTETLFHKFVLDSDCVYVVLSMCVKIVNAVVLIKR